MLSSIHKSVASVETFLRRVFVYKFRRFLAWK